MSWDEGSLQTYWLDARRYAPVAGNARGNGFQRHNHLDLGVAGSIRSASRIWRPTKSDGGGYFKFTEHYKPFTCMSDISAGPDIYSAVISGCLDFGDRDDALPVKKAAIKPRH